MRVIIKKIIRDNLNRIGKVEKINLNNSVYETE